MLSYKILLTFPGYLSTLTLMKFYLAVPSSSPCINPYSTPFTYLQYHLPILSWLPSQGH